MVHWVQPITDLIRCTQDVDVDARYVFSRTVTALGITSADSEKEGSWWSARVVKWARLLNDAGQLPHGFESLLHRHLEE